MESGYSLSDLAAATGGNGSFGGNGAIWLLIILFFIMGGNGGFGNRGYMNSDLNTFATASSQNEILLGQKFDSVQQGITALGNGISSLGYNQLEQMNDIKTAVHAEGEATRAMIQQNKIESLQQQISALQLQSATCNVVRWPNAATYSAGYSPFCNCGGSGF